MLLRSVLQRHSLHLQQGAGLARSSQMISTAGEPMRSGKNRFLQLAALTLIEPTRCMNSHISRYSPATSSIFTLCRRRSPATFSTVQLRLKRRRIQY